MRGFWTLFQLFAFLKSVAQLFAKGIVAVAAGIESDGVELIQVDLAVGEDGFLDADVLDPAMSSPVCPV